jgi:radical SAM superfamily enzyme YgiQ (UPF0313 family)
MNKKNNVLLIWPERDKGFYDFDPVGMIIGHKTLFFPLSLLYVAASLGEEWNYTLVDAGIDSVTDNLIESTDFFMISVNILQRYSAEALLERLIPHNKPIIIGGPLISTLDDIFERHLVCKVYGEIEARCRGSESTIAELLSRDMKNGTLKKEYRSHGHPDLTKNLLPRYDLVQKNKYFAFSMQTSRGCPHSCDFCQQITLFGRHHRKTIKQVINELEAMLRFNQNLTIFIIDDNVMGDISNPEQKKEFITLLKTVEEWQVKHHYPFDFFTQCSLDVAEHEDVVELMSRVGFNMMFVGIESTDEEALASVHKHQNLEQDILKRIETLRRYGMGIIAGVIIGFDNDSDDSIASQIRFIEKTGIPLIAPSLMVAFPGTRLFKRLKKEGRISRNTDTLTKAFHTNVLPKKHPDIQYGFFKRYLMEIYNPRTYFNRCIRWISSWNDAFVIPGKKGSLPSNVRFKRVCRSFFLQGIVSEYRFEYWKYLVKALLNFYNNYNKLALALYLSYMFEAAYISTRNAASFSDHLPKYIIDEWLEYSHSIDRN